MADYVITADRMPMILERYRSDPAFAERMADASGVAGSAWRPPPWSGSSPGSRTRYGGARSWALSSGVPDDVPGPDGGRCSSTHLPDGRSTAGRSGPIDPVPHGPARIDPDLDWGRDRFDLGADHRRRAGFRRADDRRHLRRGYLVWRYGRSKWRAFHSHGAVVAAAALWEATVSGRLRPRAPCHAEAAVTGGRPARSARRCGGAVDQADAAVRAAAGVGAPTASLPSLCRRLREAAIAVDQVLRVDPAGPVPPRWWPTRPLDVVRAAGDLQRAAVASASDATGHQVRTWPATPTRRSACSTPGWPRPGPPLPRTRA